MTREEQIKQYCAEQGFPYGCCSSIDSVKAIVATEAIKWADEHPKSPWIRVNESLPRDYEPKIILLKDGQVRTALLDSTDENDFKIEYYWYDRKTDNVFDLEDVVAWMPIPKLEEE